LKEEEEGADRSKVHLGKTEIRKR